MLLQVPISLNEQLIQIVRNSSSLMAALRAVRDLNLTSWAIGAGSVRNTVWDHLNGFVKRTPAQDVDVVFFDRENLSREREQELQCKLSEVVTDVRWDVTNQAAVHLWYEKEFGQTVAPLASLEEGISTWPEYATCIGIRLHADDQLEVIEPHGLEDLFSMLIQWNPTRVTSDAYFQRVRQKAFSNCWPQVRTLLPFDESSRSS
jgi:uncharacterized protein